MNAQDAEPYIYADNAATTPLSPAALEAMMPFLTDAFGNPSGIHRVARQAAEALGAARARIAELLGADRADEVYFTSGGSESDNWMLRGAVQRFRDLYGSDATPRIITSSIEHHAILHCCEALEREGVSVTYLPVDGQGFVRVEDLEAALIANEQAARAERVSNCPDAERDLDCTDATGESAACRPVATSAKGGGEHAASAASHRAARKSGDREIAGGRHDEDDSAAPHPPATALVSIMLANNEVGTIEPIRELAAVAHRHGAPFHTDAVQAVGHIAVDVRELGVDALSLSAHKFHGPRGVGALYLHDGFSIPPLIAGGAQERGERAGTENLAGIVGMAAALDEAVRSLDKNAQRVSAARDELVRHVLTSCGGARLTGAPCADAAGAAGGHAFTTLSLASAVAASGPIRTAATSDHACAESASSEARTGSEANPAVAVVAASETNHDAVASAAAPETNPVATAVGASEANPDVSLPGIAAGRRTPGRLPSIASFSCDNIDGELLVVLLDRAGVAAATGSACSTGSTEPSHVLTAMGLSPSSARGALRLSLAESITREELDLLKQRIPAAIKRARLMSGIGG